MSNDSPIRKSSRTSQGAMPAVLAGVAPAWHSKKGGVVFTSPSAIPHSPDHRLEIPACFWRWREI